MLTLSKEPLVTLELEQVKQSFEDRLEFLGLSFDALAEQDLPQLTESLERIENCIEHPEKFKLLEVKHGEPLQRYIPYSGINLNFDTLFVPLLLERKRFILERLESLQVAAKVQDLHTSIRLLTDSSSQPKLLEEIDELGDLSLKWREQLHQLTQEQQKLRAEADKTKLAYLEQRHKLWLSVLKKDSVATLIGAFLLLLITIAQVWLLLVGVKPSETLNNSFLLIPIP